MRRLLLLVFLLLSAPATASAALEETPPVKVGGARSERIQTTGPTGEVAAVTKQGPRLFTATRDGFKAAVTPAFSGGEDVLGCPAASTAAGGAGVIACCRYAYRPAAAVRDPGGSWSEPSELTDDDGGSVDALTTAVSERGDAIVLFTRTRGQELRLSAVRRTPGGAFGEPEVVAGPFRISFDPSEPRLESFQAAMTADGETIVLYELPEGEHAGPRRNTVDVMVVTAPAGGRYGAPQRLAAMPRLSRASLAVAPDGHALVSLTDATSIEVSERAPGQPFAMAVRVAAHKDPVGARTRVALDAAGRAAIAWSGIAFGGVTAVTRAPSGAFSAPVALASAVHRLPVDVLLVKDGGFSYPIPAGGWYFGGADVHTGLDAGGAWVAWDAPREADGVAYSAAALAALPFDGSPATTKTVGGRIADARAVTRVTLADGSLALTWVDDESRLRLAAEGALTATAPLPEVHAGRPLKTRLGVLGKLHLPIRCRAPCDVRGQLLGRAETDARLTLERGGEGTLVIDGYGDYLAPRRPGRVRVALTYGAPGGQRTATRTLSLRLSQKRARPRAEQLPQVHNLRAVRHGDRIDVTWTTDSGTTSFFMVFGTRTRSRFELPAAETHVADEQLRRRFSMTLPAAGVRFVTLIPISAGPGKLVVRVR